MLCEELFYCCSDQVSSEVSDTPPHTHTCPSTITQQPLVQQAQNTKGQRDHLRAWAEGKYVKLHGVELFRGFPLRAVLGSFPIFQNPLLASAGFQAPAFLNQIAEFKPSS